MVQACMPLQPDLLAIVDFHEIYNKIKAIFI